MASCVSHGNPDVCLCGEGRVGRSLVRQWVEYYTSRVRCDSQWDTLSRERLIGALLVRVCCTLGVFCILLSLVKMSGNW